jgi:chorismate mutase/prephenate dehydrogenase
VVQAKAEERAEGAAPSVLVVGGGGQMGRLVGRALGERGARVAVLERDDGQDRAAVVKAADLVVLAVPMGAAVEVARELGPWVREDALLCDINSLKGEICEVMGEVCRGEVLGMHPMFGPTVASLLRQKWVLCPVRPGRWSRWLEGELGKLGLELLRSEPRAHDRMMSAVQVLVHFHTLVMGEALRRAGLGVEESLRFTSPIYRIELAVVGRLFGQDPDLYAEIEMSNPYGREVLGHFLEATLSLKEIIDAGDRDAFRGVFGEVAEHFGEFKGEALALSDFLIEELVRKA